MNSIYPRGYIIENNHEFDGINVIKAHEIQSPEFFLTICSKGGFELARLKSVKDLKVMAAIALL